MFNTVIPNCTMLVCHVGMIVRNLTNSKIGMVVKVDPTDYELVYVRYRGDDSVELEATLDLQRISDAAKL